MEPGGRPPLPTRPLLRPAPAAACCPRGDQGMKSAFATRLAGSADLYHRNNRRVGVRFAVCALCVLWFVVCGWSRRVVQYRSAVQR